MIESEPIRSVVALCARGSLTIRDVVFGGGIRLCLAMILHLDQGLMYLVFEIEVHSALPYIAKTYRHFIGESSLSCFPRGKHSLDPQLSFGVDRMLSLSVSLELLNLVLNSLGEESLEPFELLFKRARFIMPEGGGETCIA